MERMRAMWRKMRRMVMSLLKWVSSWSGEFRDQVSGRCLTPTSKVLETEGNSVVVDECDSKVFHLQEWDYEKDDGQGNHNVLPSGKVAGFTKQDAMLTV